MYSVGFGENQPEMASYIYENLALQSCVRVRMQLTAGTNACHFEVSIIINKKRDYIIKLKRVCILSLLFSDCKIVRMTQFLNVIMSLLYKSMYYSLLFVLVFKIFYLKVIN